MKIYLIAGIFLMMAFGVSIVAAREQSQDAARLVTGAAAGVLAGFAVVCFLKSRRRGIDSQPALPDEVPKLRWQHYGLGLAMSGLFGALLAAQYAMAGSTQVVVAVSAGVVEAAAYMVLSKAVRAGGARLRHGQP